MCECYGKIIITPGPLISNTVEEVIEAYNEKGNMMFENEYTKILNNFIDEQIKFTPMMSIMIKDPEEDIFVLNIYQDMDQTKLYKSFRVSHVDFIQTGMTVESWDDKYELFKLVVYNEYFKLRDVYLIGFIQYQIPKWKKMLSVQK